MLRPTRGRERPAGGKRLAEHSARPVAATTRHRPPTRTSTLRRIASDGLATDVAPPVRPRAFATREPWHQPSHGSKNRPRGAESAAADRSTPQAGRKVACWCPWCSRPASAATCTGDRSRIKSCLPGFAKSNGRIEATEVDIATKLSGRFDELLADEGGFVDAGQVLARMDTAVLKGPLREAVARLARAESAVETAAEHAHAAGGRESRGRGGRGAARGRSANARPRSLNAGGGSNADRGRRRTSSSTRTVRQFLAPRQRRPGEGATLRPRRPPLPRPDPRSSPRKRRSRPPRPRIERIQSDIDDSELRSPRHGRVQYRVGEPGEVLMPAAWC